MAATLLMYLVDTMALCPQHVLYTKMFEAGAACGLTDGALMAWGCKIREHFVVSNMMGLSAHQVKSSLSPEARAEVFVGTKSFQGNMVKILAMQQDMAQQSLRCYNNLAIAVEGHFQDVKTRLTRHDVAIAAIGSKLNGTYRTVTQLASGANFQGMQS